ncbi:MAG: MotA/TolQ/ExbB proton channel family protein [Fibrobacteria bacterium]|nr:MotA/TolQ/ExbB proton channel family protein [Fibrobacteria bacterium]
MNVFLELFLSFSPSANGYGFMWILLLLVFLFIYLFVRQFTFYKKIGNVHPEKFLIRLKKLITEGKVEEAEAICKAGNTRALAQIAGAALVHREATPEMIKSNVEEVVVGISAKVESRNSFFAVTGNIATLIGLMGTIYGLVLAFAAVGKPGVPMVEKTSMLASGISTAMNTTLFGLIIAVPCMLAYSWFQTRAEKMIEHFDRQGASILNSLFDIDVKLKNYKPSERRRKKDVAPDLDITPIMGLMVVLIPLLLSSAEFVKIGVIEMNLPKSGGGAGSNTPRSPEEKPKKLDLGLIISTKGIRISSTLPSEEGVPSEEYQVKIKNKDFDYPALASELKTIKVKILGVVLADYYSNAQIESANLFQLMKLMKEVDVETMFHYKDFETVKIIADNKMHFQKIINIMDVSRDITVDGQKIPLFPVVSIGAGF